MKNIMKFKGGYKAVISYDEETCMFRGEFIGLNGGADFYAKDAEGLKKEGQISLDIFLRMCKEDGVQAKKQYSNFALRLDPETYYEASTVASASGMSLNKWITRTIREAVGNS